MYFYISTDEQDSYIVVSFVNATLVLSIGETVEEVTDSGFLGTTPTLSCSLLGEDALLQVIVWLIFDLLNPFNHFCFTIFNWHIYLSIKNHETKLYAQKNILKQL